MFRRLYPIRSPVLVSPIVCLKSPIVVWKSISIESDPASLVAFAVMIPLCEKSSTEIVALVTAPVKVELPSIAASMYNARVSLIPSPKVNGSPVVRDGM